MTATRERLDADRTGKTRPFRMRYADETSGEPRVLKFYVTANAYPDGRIAEVFIRGDKIGSFLGGALDTWAVMFSMAMQHGIPMSSITEKLRHQRFGPGGFGSTGDPRFPSCTSMFDLIAQWLEYEYPNGIAKEMQGRQTDATEPKVEEPK